jgi:hypothetical protein
LADSGAVLFASPARSLTSQMTKDAIRRLIKSQSAVDVFSFASGFLLALALIYINRRAILIFYTQLFG